MLGRRPFVIPLYNSLLRTFTMKRYLLYIERGSSQQHRLNEKRKNTGAAFFLFSAEHFSFSHLSHIIHKNSRSMHFYVHEATDRSTMRIKNTFSGCVYTFLLGCRSVNCVCIALNIIILSLIAMVVVEEVVGLHNPFITH